jgi:hypothetical protein
VTISLSFEVALAEALTIKGELSLLVAVLLEERLTIVLQLGLLLVVNDLGVFRFAFCFYTVRLLLPGFLVVGLVFRLVLCRFVIFVIS